MPFDPTQRGRTSASQFGIWRIVADYLLVPLQKAGDPPAAQRQPAGSFSPITLARDPEPTGLEVAIKPAALIQTSDGYDSTPAEPAASIEPHDAGQDHNELDRLLDSIRRDSGYLAPIKNSEAAVDESLPSATASGEQPREELDRLLDSIRRDSGYLAPIKNSEAAVDESLPSAPASGEQPREELDRLLDSIRRDSGYLGAIKNSEAEVSPVDDGSRQGAPTRGDESHEEVDRLLDSIKHDSGYLGTAGDFEGSNGLHERLQKSASLPHTISEPQCVEQEASSEAPMQENGSEALANSPEPPHLEPTMVEGRDETLAKPAQSLDALPGDAADSEGSAEISTPGLDSNAPPETDGLHPDEPDFADSASEGDAARTSAIADGIEVEKHGLRQACYRDQKRKYDPGKSAKL